MPTYKNLTPTAQFRWRRIEKSERMNCSMIVKNQQDRREYVFEQAYKQEGGGLLVWLPHPVIAL
ncbi:MAG: hypothetical protein Q4G66_07860 [bacterium]|nr:hypothetical protein [bacterium]